MKRQIFTIFMALVLTAATGLMAQSGGGSGGGANSGAVSGGSGSTGTTTGTTTGTMGTLPPSQQVDQSGQPEHTGRPDVDVDTGSNANNGVLNMDVKRNGDSDTKAGNNPNGNQMGTTGTSGSMNTGTTTTTTTGTTGTDTTTGSYSGDTTSTGSSVSGSRSMPRTASDMPLVGLLGALALAGALGLRSAR